MCANKGIRSIVVFWVTTKTTSKKLGGLHANKNKGPIRQRKDNTGLVKDNTRLIKDNAGLVLASIHLMLNSIMTWPSASASEVGPG